MDNFNVIFEYDPVKSEANLQKHGITLEKARALWAVRGIEVKARVSTELRWMRIGKIDGKYYSCIFTVRGQKIRLISARRSRIEEERICQEGMGHEEEK